MKLVYWVTVCLVYSSFAGNAYADAWDQFYEKRRKEVNATSSMDSKEGLVSAKDRAVIEKDIQQKVKKYLAKKGKGTATGDAAKTTNQSNVKKRTYQQGPVSNQQTSIKVDAVPGEMVFPGRKTPAKKR